MHPHRRTESLARAIQQSVRGITVTTATETLLEYESDFGRVVRRRPAVVARPGNSEEVAGLVEVARKQGLRIAPQGAAHTQGGQSLVRDGILLDLRELAGEITVEDDHFAAGAGQYWRDVVRATLRKNRIPPVLTTHLFTTIGGTHSTGGIGHASFRHGTQADNCLDIEIVTGAGEIVHASAEQNPELFRHALAGLGQLGVITRITHRVRRYADFAHSVRLAFRDRRQMLQVARELMADPTIEHINMEAFSVRGQWIYALRITREVDDEDTPQEPLTDAVGHAVQTLSDTVMPFPDWIMRGRQGEPPPRSIQPGMIRPGLDLLLPADSAGLFTEKLKEILPHDLITSALLLILLVDGQKCRLPLFPAPPGNDLELYSILPTVPAEQWEKLRPILQKAYQSGVDHGGMQYLTGWIPDENAVAATWQQSTTLAELRTLHDPHNIFQTI